MLSREHFLQPTGSVLMARQSQPSSVTVTHGASLPWQVRISVDVLPEQQPLLLGLPALVAMKAALNFGGSTAKLFFTMPNDERYSVELKTTGTHPCILCSGGKSTVIGRRSESLLERASTGFFRRANAFDSSRLAHRRRSHDPARNSALVEALKALEPITPPLHSKHSSRFLLFRRGPTPHHRSVTSASKTPAIYGETLCTDPVYLLAFHFRIRLTATRPYPFCFRFFHRCK